MNSITVAGNLGKDAELRAVGSEGTSVCNFSVASEEMEGRNKITVWYRCALWGKRGETLAQYLLKGTKVTVVGTLSSSIYNDKVQLSVRVNEIALQGKSASSGSGGVTRPRRDQPPPPPDDDGGSEPAGGDEYPGSDDEVLF